MTEHSAYFRLAVVLKRAIGFETPTVHASALCGEFKLVGPFRTTAKQVHKLCSLACRIVCSAAGHDGDIHKPGTR